MDASHHQSSIVILITREGIGNAETPLQQKLLSTYLTLLGENRPFPAAICFYTDGVKLAIEGSPVLQQLKFLENEGVRLILCQTCLNYFGILDKVQVGIVGGMADIIEAQWKAEKVITL